MENRRIRRAENIATNRLIAQHTDEWIRTRTVALKLLSRGAD